MKINYLYLHRHNGVKLLTVFLGLFLLGSSAERNTGEKATITPNVITPLYQGKVTITYTAGKHGIEVGGGIIVRFPKKWRLQIKKPKKDYFVNVALSSKESGHKTVFKRGLLPIPGEFIKAWRNIFVTITKKPLIMGDTISLTIYRKGPQKTPAYTSYITVASDIDGDGNFALVDELPRFTIRSSSPQKIYAIAPSTRQAGKEFTLKLAVLDSSYNAVTDYTATVELVSTDKDAKLPKTYTFSPEDGGVGKIAVVINTPGYHTVTVSEKGGNMRATSNPIYCKDPAPPKEIYWGDLHSHSELSWDGIGKDPFKYAKEVASLDFYSLTEHFSNITSHQWDFIKDETIRFHQPGEFVTILAYEASMHSPSGHYNVLINCPNDIIPRIQIALRSDLKVAPKEMSVLKLWEFLKKTLPPAAEAITIPHHTGVAWNPKKSPFVSFHKPYQNPKVRVAIEIFSKQGSSEKYDLLDPLAYHNWLHPLADLRENKSIRRHFPRNGPHYAQDAWAKKLYLGTIAATDDHEAHPGMPGKSTPYNPLAAVYANELTRNAIFKAIKKRETYATSGERIILNFKLNNHPMGSEVILAEGVKPTFSVTARGTDLIDYVEILKWDFKSGKFDKDNHPVFEAVLHKEVKALDADFEYVDKDYKDHSLYYVRLKQLQTVTDNVAWAWSSPIWVKKKVE